MHLCFVQQRHTELTNIEIANVMPLSKRLGQIMRGISRANLQRVIYRKSETFCAA
jgi:hypothetical protein